MKTAFLRAGTAFFLCLAAMVFGTAHADDNPVYRVTDTNIDNLTAALQAAQTNGGTVLLDVNGTFALNSTLDITTNILIAAPTNRTVSISGGNAVRVFTVERDAVLTLLNIGIVNGLSTMGAGIYNSNGTVLALGCTFEGNTATNSVGASGRAGSHDNPDGGDGRPGGNAAGGAIYSAGTLTIYSSIFTNNFAWGGTGGDGGAGYTNAGTFGANGGNGGNGGSASGGAVYIAEGTGEFGWCAFEKNEVAAGFGGLPGDAGPGGFPGDGGKGGAGSLAYGAGIYNGGTLTLFNNLFVNNLGYGGSSAGAQPYGDGSSRTAFNGGASFGGAIYNVGAVGITNCTLAGNVCQGGGGGNVSGSRDTAGNGGNACGAGLANVGKTSAMDILNCTIAMNTLYGGTNGVTSDINSYGAIGLKLGAGIYNNSGVITIANSILDQGTNQPNSYGTLIDHGYNISSDNTCHFKAAGSTNNLSAKLGKLLVVTAPPTSLPPIQVLRPETDVSITFQLPTVPGLLPQPGSPAIDAIPTNAIYPPIDQRGFSRPQGTAVDIGAIELQTEALAPTITTQPVGGTFPAGTNISLSVEATGESPLSYRWYFNGLPINGATNSVLTITFAQSSDSGNYSVVVSNPIDSITSSNAIVDVAAPVVIAGIFVNDATGTNIDVMAGTDVTLSTSVTGDSPYGYLWYHNNAALTNETSDSLVLPAIQSQDAGTYSVVVTNSISTSTNTVVITVHAPASITTEPTDQALLVGSDIALSVATDGDKPITYQWIWNGQTYGPTTNSTFLIQNAQADAENVYSVMVSNRFNTDWVTSSEAQVTFYRPLTITTQPVGGTVDYGSDTNLIVAVDSNAGGLTYQWYLNNQPIEDATNDTLFITEATSTDAGVYMVVVEDAVSRAGSSNAVLKVGVPPRITSQPHGQVITPGLPAVFRVGVTDSGPVTYQWWHDDMVIPDATNATLTIRQPQSADIGSYWVTVSGAHGTIDSAVAMLLPKVVITAQPDSQTVASGASAMLQVTATGDPTRYQWYRNGVPLAGQTNDTLVFRTARKSDSGVYRVIAGNQLVSVASANATLKVLDAPVILTGSQPLTNNAGSMLRLSVAARGDGPFSYQWQFQGNDLPNANRATLTVPRLSVTSGGTYSVVVKNPVGNATGDIAVVTLIPPSPVIRTAAKPVTTNDVLLSGTADISAGISNVLIQVNEDSINASSSDGWRTWSAHVPLALGTNYISAITQAPYGNSTPARIAIAYKATYSPDPYASKKGTYLGLFFDPQNPQQSSSGAINLTLKEMGIFSGKLLQGTNSYPISGQFETNGYANIRSGSLIFQISFDLEKSVTNLVGTISGPEWTGSPLQMYRTVYTAAHLAPMAGKYTLAFPGETDNDGDGVLTVRVDRLGTAVASGVLADSSTVSGANTVCSGGQWPMYLPANSGQGSLFGWLTFDSQTNLAGTATWIAPADTLFPDGVIRTAEVLASPYSPQTNGAPAVSLQTGIITLSGGNLAAPFTANVVLANNVFTVDSTNLVLKLNATNGLVNGTFHDTTSGTIDPVYGVVLKNQQTVRGFFIGTTQSGKMRAE